MTARWTSEGPERARTVRGSEIQGSPTELHCERTNTPTAFDDVARATLGEALQRDSRHLIGVAVWWLAVGQSCRRLEPTFHWACIARLFSLAPACTSKSYCTKHRRSADGCTVGATQLSQARLRQTPRQRPEEGARSSSGCCCTPIPTGSAERRFLAVGSLGHTGTCASSTAERATGNCGGVGIRCGRDRRPSYYRAYDAYGCLEMSTLSGEHIRSR